jgi:hypothetical protein
MMNLLMKTANFIPVKGINGATCSHFNQLPIIMMSLPSLLK